MTSQQDSAFRHLLGTWNRHQGLRRDDASVRDLAASRRILDEARLQAMRIRA